MARHMYRTSRRDIEEARRAVQRERERAQRDRVARQDLTNHAIKTASVAGGAFAAGLIQGRHFARTGNKLMLGPIPADLLIGAGLIAGSYYTPGRMVSNVLEGVGEGILALSVGTLGAGLGLRMGGGTSPQGQGGATPPAAGTETFAFTSGVPMMAQGNPYPNAWYGGVNDAQMVDMFRQGMA